MSPQTSPCRVLYVDDNLHDRELVRDALQHAEHAFELTEAATIAELQRHLDAGEFDLVLSDFNILGFEGLDVLEAVQARSPGTPVVIVTGTGSEEVAVEALRRGAADYVIKTPQHIRHLPFTLLTAVEQAQLRTERRRAAEELRRAKARAERYLEVAAVMLLGLDRQGRIALLNRRGCEVLGLESQEAALGRDWLDFIPPERRDRTREILGAIMDGDLEPHLRVEGRVVTVDGERRDIIWHNAVLRDEHGAITGTLSSGQDVTERRELEAQLAQADRLASMGLLAAGVAHEINNPLSYVLYNLESMTEDLPRLVRDMRDAVAGDGGEAGRQRLNPIDIDDLQDRFRDALEGARRVRDVVRGLSTFSRVEENRVVPVELPGVIDAAVSMARNEVRYRARLVKDYGKVPPVPASEGKLSQVFLNLIINAAHAIEEGDVEGNEIRVRTWAEGDVACAEVSDTGKGIPPGHLARLFDPFFTTKHIGRGSGLGLSISRSIVEGYGGTIQVRSTPGRGTSFTLRFPLRERSRAAEAAEAPAPRREPRVRGRVLVVDDEERVRGVVARMLRSHDTVQAVSGEQAREILAEDQAFDVIICDMMMPGFSGMDLHGWLQQEHPRLARRVIFVTGGAFTPRAQEYLERVDNLRLEKPFNAANLRRIVGDRIELERNG